MRTTHIPLATVLLTLLCSFALAGEVVVPFVSGEATITDAGCGMITALVPGMSPASSGNPALSYTRQYVLLPSDADVTTLRVEMRNAVEESVPGTFAIAPMPPAAISDPDGPVKYWGNDKTIVGSRNVLVYEEDSFYPACNAVLEPECHAGPYLMVPVQFWPYRYNPVTGELIRLVSGDVAVMFASKPSFQKATRIKAAPACEERVRAMAVNAGQVSAWYGQTRQFQDVIGPSNAVLILTDSDIVSSSTELANFVAYKQSKGFTVDVVTESAWGGGTYYTAADNIRAYLQTVYQDYKYLILMGYCDPWTGTIPSRLVWPHGAGQVEYVPTDYIFADLTGNWDLDGDGYLAEPGTVAEGGDFGPGGVDLVPELIVGRIPYYGSITDLDSILLKIRTYDTQATMGSWVQRMLLATKPLDDVTPGYQYGEQIKQWTCNEGQRQYYRIYDDVYDCLPAPEVHPTTEADVLSAWQQNYGFVFWMTHGWSQGASYIFSTNSVPYLNNAYPSFVYSASCSNAYPYDSNNLAYALLKNGAIASVAYSAVSYYYIAQTDFMSTDSIGGIGYAYSRYLAYFKQACGDALWSTLAYVPCSLWSNHVALILYGDPTIAPRWPTTFQMVSTSPLPSGKRNVVYRKDLWAAGGTTPYTWTCTYGSLPSGLTLNSAGYISGTPTRAQTRTFTLRCTKSGGGYVSRTFSLTITN